MARQARGRRRPHDPGKLYLDDGETAKALGQFEAVNPHSDRYGTAKFLAGYVYWRLYIKEKSKPEAARDKAALADDLAKTVNAMSTSVELQHKAWKLSGVKEMPTALMDAQSMLAKVYLEAGAGQKAADQFQPLIDELTKRKPEKLDDTMLQIFLGAVRAYVATNDLEKASVAGMKLVELGPDSEVVNDALLRFAALLDGERKKAEAGVIAAVDPAEAAAAKQRLAGMNDMLDKLLTKLASREKVSPKGMIWIAVTSSTVGNDKAAETQCQGFLKRFKEDTDFRKAAGPQAVTRIRTLLIHILGKTGKFEDAINQVTDLIKEHPSDLEPRMEECRLRHGWAMKVADELVPAEKACEALRNNAGLAKVKKKPPAYYEVVYYEANLLSTEGKQFEKDGKKADAAAAGKKAEQILKYALFFSPKLDGPDRVAQYKKLLDEAAELQK